jgi:hypothetical protein
LAAFQYHRSRASFRRHEDEPMPSNEREIYRSENGDRWLLCREDSQVFVLHRANEPSGGKLTRIELEDFLRKGNAGPEHQALVRLIGSLVDHE